MIPLTGNRCRCSACGRVFSTPGNFDRHRSGPWEGRVCLDPASVGLFQSPSGVWKALSDPSKRHPSDFWTKGEPIH